MLIYNVTITVDNDVRPQWLHWMKTEHMPAVLSTGLFTGYNLFKVRVSEEQGTTYSAQYACENDDKLNEYNQLYAPLLKQQGKDKFGDKFTAFRTVLELEE